MASGDESSQCLKYCCYGDDDICQPGWNIRGVVTEVVPCDEDCSMLGY